MSTSTTRSTSSFGRWDAERTGRRRVTVVVLRDGLPLAGWVEDRPPRVFGFDAHDWGDVREEVGRDGRPWWARESGGTGWADDEWRHDDGWSPARGPQSVPLGPTADERRLAELEREVGGADELATLGTGRLPVEEPDLTLVPPGLRGHAQEVLDVAGEALDRWFHAEARTAAYRLVARVCADRPDVVEQADPQRLAATVLWMSGRANHVIGPKRVVTNKELLDHFGQPAHVVDRLSRLLLPLASEWGHAVTRATGDSGYLLGRADLLVATRRLAIVRERDALTPRLDAARPPVLETVSPEESPAWERSLHLLTGGDPKDEGW